MPIGPVVVFGASNFPLAFSVAGGDTASALAAGCPVVVKAHHAHPGTSEMVARAIVKAVAETEMPAGVFSLLYGAGHEVGIGSGQTSVDARRSASPARCAAGARCSTPPQAGPIRFPFTPRWAASIPVFILPGALRERAEAIAEGLKNSVTMGVGQFCTCPGLAVGLLDENFARFADKLGGLIADAQPGTMLYPGILRRLRSGREKTRAPSEGLQTTQSRIEPDAAKTEARPTVFSTNARTFLRHHELSEEVFGPSTVVVSCDSREEMEQIARDLEGHLTATIHGTAEDLRELRLAGFDPRKQGREIDLQRLPDRRRSLRLDASRRAVSRDDRFSFNLSRHGGDLPIRAPGLLSELSAGSFAGRVAERESTRRLEAG